MSRDLEIVLPARTSALRSCLSKISDSCARRNLGPDTSRRLSVVVEELFSNTVKYGYAGECERPVRVSLRCSPEVELVYEDEAPPFDPVAWLAATRPEATGTQEVASGRGIALVLGLARSARYEPLPGGNRLTLSFE